MFLNFTHKKINKVLLLSPPVLTNKGKLDINPLPPIGLGYLASSVNDLCKVKILDCLINGWDNGESINKSLVRIGTSYEDIRKEIIEFNPDLVGLNCQFSKQYSIYRDLLSIIKNIDSDIITITGGAHTTVCPNDMLQDKNCDFIILGEGEKSFREFVKNINNTLELYKIDGFGYKIGGEIIINEKNCYIDNLDDLKFPAYDLMGLEKYFGLKHSHGLRHKKRCVPIITSRGCPAKCIFCTAKCVWGNKFRARSVNNVIEEIRYLKSRYDIEEIMFEDDNLTADRKRAKLLFNRIIEEGFDIVWDTPNGVGVWSLDEELIDLMKSSGCIKLNFPVESGSQRVLDNIIKKPIKLSKVEKLINYCKKINLDYGIFLVIGLPGETLKDMWKSIKFAAKMGVINPHISIATPYPGSDLFNMCSDKGYLIDSFSYDDLFIRSFSIETPDWNKNDLREFLLKARIYLIVRKFISNPLHVCKLIICKIVNVLKNK